MRLSIIIPTWNEAELIGEALARAAALDPWEVIVVDGQSTDRTAELARAGGACVLTSRPGRGRQLAAGAAAATGDVFLFLHVDTWLAPAAREQLNQALADPAVLGGGFRQAIDAPGVLYRWLEVGNRRRVQWWGLAYGDQGIFVRRETYQELGGFPDVPLMEDVLFMRAFRRLSRPVLLPGPLHVSARRWRAQGVIRQTLRNWTVLAAFRLGVSPHRLATWYARGSHGAGTGRRGQEPRSAGS